MIRVSAPKNNHEYCALIAKMSRDELLAHVVYNPDQLTDPYYRMFGTAIRDRFAELQEAHLELCGERMETEDRIVKIAGVSFKCPCGCNVFRCPVGKSDVYVCNACGDRFRGEA